MNNLEKKYDAIIAATQWVFDETVSDCFDNMLERSIPGYNRMRHLVFSFGKAFVQEHTTIVDVGCSLGNALVPFVQHFGNMCSYLGIEQSEPMVNKAREQFRSEIAAGYVEIMHSGIEDCYLAQGNSLVLSVLTLQFIPPVLRPPILRNIYDSLTVNGALILVEKTCTDDPKMDALYEKVYYDMKREHGYTEEQIFAKKESLKNVLIPFSRSENEKILRDAGFSIVECFWTDIMFTAWIAIKEQL